MLKRDRRQFPDWAQRERADDLSWIQENLHVFLSSAQQGYENSGRGAPVVDTTLRPTGAGHPFGYLPQEEIEKMNDQDVLCRVRAYDPTWEFVAMLFKSQDRVSTHRVGAPSQKENSVT